MPEQASRYRPDIDGLRALAVLPVLLFHAQLGCPGGFVGVDVFFVISGYLITSLIVKERAEGKFSLVAFWERRIRRIVPAWTGVVLATVAGGWFVCLPEDFAQLGKSVVAQASLLSNVFFYRQALVPGGGYFASRAETKALLHTWSLAVEEQFYLLFPLVLILLTRSRRRSGTAFLSLLALVSLALSVYGTMAFPQATFYLLPTRAWELLLGALLAMTRGGPSPGAWVREGLGWVGLGLIAASVFAYDGHTRFPGLAALPPCLGTAAIIFSSESQLSRIGRILSFKPLVFIGLISYSLYLWHWPALVLSKYLAYGPQSTGLRVALLGASAALAILSWKFVETPIRARNVLGSRRQILGFAGGTMMVLLTLGGTIVRAGGIPSRISRNVFLQYADWRNHRSLGSWTSLDQALAGDFEGLGLPSPKLSPSILLWGDSHAMAISPVLDDLCRRHSKRGVRATAPGTAPVLGYVSQGERSLREESPAFNQAVLAFIAQKRIRNLVLAAHWSGYPPSESFKSQLIETVRAVIGLGVRVYVLKSVPIQEFDVPRLAAVTVLRQGDLEALGISREQHERAMSDLQPTFDRLSQMGAVLLDPAEYFLNRRNLYGVVRDQKILYWDDNHLTVEGAMMLAPLFERIFAPE